MTHTHKQTNMMNSTSCIEMNIPYLMDKNGEKIGHIKVKGVNAYLDANTKTMRYELPLDAFLRFFSGTMRSQNGTGSQFNMVVSSGGVKGMAVILDFAVTGEKQKKGILLYYNRCLTCNCEELYDDMEKRLSTLGKCTIDTFKYFSFNVFVFPDDPACDKFETEWMEVANKTDEKKVKCKTPPRVEHVTIDASELEADIEEDVGDHRV